MNYSKQLLQFQIGADKKPEKEISEVWQIAHCLSEFSIHCLLSIYSTAE